MADRPGILLDTCALIFIANDTEITPEAEREISDAAFDGRLHVSVMSAWEIGVAVAKRRLILPLPPLEFFNRFLDRLNARLSPVSPDILISSSGLPGDLHKDPIDRILIASARMLDMVLATRDRPILEYGSAGHLRALAC